MTFETKTLGEGSCFFNNLRKPVTRSQRLGGQYPYYGAAGIQDFVSEFLFDGRYILVGEDGTVVNDKNHPVVQIADGKFWVNNHAHVIQPIDMDDFEYLYYCLVNSNISELVTGAVQPKLSMTNLKSLNFEWAALSSVRKSIGDVLGLLDAKISSNRKISETLEQIAQTIFKSWFIDFDPVKAKMAGKTPHGLDDATAAFFPDSMENSELGQIPKGWVIKPFFDFQLEIESGSRPKGGVKGIADGVPSIGAESINGLGVFEFSKTKYISEEFFQKMNKGIPKDFDVLLYKDGGKPGEFKPRVGMFGRGFPFKQYAINEHVFLLRSAELGPAFTYFWIQMERTLDVLRNRGIKAAIPGINQQDVGTLPVLWSSPQLIEKFTELCMPYLELILTLASESLELSRLRDALLPRLISGELQIPEEMLVS